MSMCKLNVYLFCEAVVDCPTLADDALVLTNGALPPATSAICAFFDPCAFFQHMCSPCPNFPQCKHLCS